jgi:hypothetical protein
MRADVASELRDARLTAGPTQAHVARATGLGQASISRAETPTGGPVRLEALSVHFAVLGLQLSIKAYPVGAPVHDVAHLELLGRLQGLVARTFKWRAEALIGPTGDLRAWDALLLGVVRIGLDAETRLQDIQALQRRTEAKARDSGVDRVVLLVTNWRHNRRILREYAATLGTSFPLDSTTTLDALRAGRDPGANGIVRS